MSRQKRWGHSGWQRALLPLMAMMVMAAALLGSAREAQAYNTPWGKGLSRPEDLVISLATFSPGDQIPQWFGHTALVVEDRRFNTSRLYNYGMFSFGDGMLMNFAMGRLLFWVAPAPVAPTYQFYIAEDRDVRVIELNLPPETRAEVAAFLADNVRPENREYLYHHYDDNCATRVRDIIDRSVGGQFNDAFDQADSLTLRGHTRRHSQHLKPMDWLLMFLMNNEIDRPIAVWDAMFLPEVLEEAVLDFEYVDEEGNTQPLALRTHRVFESSRAPTPETPATHWPFWAGVGVLLGALSTLLGWRASRHPGRRGPRVVFGLVLGAVAGVFGLVGTGLFVMAAMTDHTVTYWNLNLLLANPLTLLGAFFALRVAFGSEGSRGGLRLIWRALAALAILGLLAQLVGLIWPTIFQNMLLPLALLLPWVLGAAAGVELACRRRQAA
ncbi:DUF4105 domain-containing protein [Lujinxingia sediminis]|uniref:DUF4105 domain-containing protein n=1 Tax=Lujinxingia sediminis TaxID=2480984 RepID=A0ABY0CQU4_9DELT|nr:DUF4105 domain-containing protein [Lujinxingia sediminis]RVU42535.1 DUF4105 domain-containing protein [Lujinxingia sediminis]